MVTRYVGRELGVSHVSILVFDEEKKHFIFSDSKGTSRLPLNLLKFETDHPLVIWFTSVRKRHKIRDDFLFKEKVRTWLANGSPSAAAAFKKELVPIERAMKNFKAELIVPGYAKGKLTGLVLLGRKTGGAHFTDKEISFFHILAQNCAMAVRATQYHQSLIAQNEKLAKQIRQIASLRKKEQDTYYEIMRSLAQEVHAKDPYTFGHLGYVERLGLMTARELGMDLSGRKKDILSASLILHDVGKIGIPDEILKKADRLNPEEWAIMKTHVDKGAAILKPLTDFKEVAEIVRCHHERYDGSGYPRGIQGKAIPLEARIITVVDAFHAIVSERTYDPARPVEEGFGELRRCAGKQFDPEIVEAFIRTLAREMKKRGTAFFLENAG